MSPLSAQPRARLAWSPPAAMRWLWPGSGLVAMGARGGNTLTATGATPAVAGRFASATRVEEATTNLVENPSFETSLAGLGGVSGATATRVNTQAQAGSWSAEVTTAGSAAGEGCSVGMQATGLGAAAGAWIAGSAWMRGSGTIEVRTLITNTDATVTSGATTTVTLTTAWQRVLAPPVQIASGKTGDYCSLRFQTASAQAVTFYLDAVQLEQHAYATSYCDGSLGAGYTWTGTAHNSVSTRAAGRLRASAPGVLHSLRGGLTCWWRPDHPATHPADCTLLHWGSGTAFLDLTYREASDRLRLTTQSGPGSTDVVDSDVQTFAAGDDVLVVAGWDERERRLTAGAGAMALTPRSALIPAIADAMFDLGSAGTSAHAAGGLGPVLLFDRPLTAGEALVLARLGRMPGWQEVP